MAKTIVSNAILYDAAGNPIIDLTQDPAVMEVPPAGTLTNHGTINGGDLTPVSVTASTTIYVQNTASNVTPGQTAGTYLGVGDISVLLVKGFTFLPMITDSLVLSGTQLYFGGAIGVSGASYGGWTALNGTAPNALQLAPGGSTTTQHNMLDDGSGNMTVAGNFSTAKPVTKVAGEATTGTYGVLTTVAATTNTEITTTGGQSLWSLTPPATGLYTVKCYLCITATTTVTVTVTYTDSGGSQTYIPDALNAQSLSAGSYSMIDYSLEATSGGAISLSVNVNTANQVYATTALVGVS